MRRGCEGVVARILDRAREFCELCVQRGVHVAAGAVVTDATERRGGHPPWGRTGLQENGTEPLG